MRRVMFLLMAGTVLSGLAAAYAATGRASAGTPSQALQD